MLLRLLTILLLGVGISTAEINDTNFHAEPAPPGIAQFDGGRMVDSTHKSVILRVTSSYDNAQYCFNSGPDYPVFNADSTRLLYKCIDPGGLETVRVREFWPAYFHIGETHTIDMKGLEWRWAAWDRTLPNVLYSTEGATICKLTINSDWTTTKTVLVDISGSHANRAMKGLHVSADGVRFTFYTDMTVSPNTATVGAGVAYSNGTLRYYTEDSGIMTGFDEATIAGDGSYAYLKTSTGGTLVNIETLATTSGTAIGASGSGSATTAYDAICLSTHLCGAKAPFSNLSSTTPLIDFGVSSGPSGTHGVSMLGESSGQAVYSFCCTHPDSKAYENEILAVPLDGSGYPDGTGIVRRLAYGFSHPESVTNATYAGFANSANASASFDGQWIAYSSTWGTNDRIDLFIVSARPKQYRISWTYGPSTLYKGHYTYMQIQSDWQGNLGQYIYFTSVVGLPSGVSVQWFCDLQPGVGKCAGTNNQEYAYVGASGHDIRIYPRFYAAGTATPGTYPVTFTLTTGGQAASVTANLTVKESPVLPLKPLPSALSKKPMSQDALDVWRGWMDNPGYSWCQNPWTINPFAEGEIWYYDGGYGFFHAADLTGDKAKWEPCAYWVIDPWRDRLNNYGYVSVGHHVFVHGLYQAWLRTGDQRYADAIEVEANHTPELASVSEGNVYKDWSDNSMDHGWFDYGRPTFYHPQALVFWEKVGGDAHVNDTIEVRPRIYIAADRAIYMLEMELNQPTDPNDRVEVQTWIMGLAMESLIEYYEHTKDDPGGPDTRVIELAKEFSDWCAARRNADGVVINNDQPKGPLCSNSSGGCQSYIALGNAFVAPAAAWYWRQTGDDTYVDLADSFFVGMAKAVIDNASKKQWAQLMRWTYDYYLWRTQGLGAPTTSRGGMRSRGGTMR